MTFKLSKASSVKYRYLQEHVARGTGIDNPSLSVVIAYCHARLVEDGVFDTQNGVPTRS